jgi:hypothetical protein
MELGFEPQFVDFQTKPREVTFHQQRSFDLPWKKWSIQNGSNRRKISHQF